MTYNTNRITALEADVSHYMERHHYKLDYYEICINVLYSGAVTKRDSCEVRYLLKDIFPGGFYRPEHRFKTHGAENNLRVPLDCFGHLRGYKYQGRNEIQEVLFAKTINGDIYMKWLNHSHLDVETYSSSSKDTIFREGDSDDTMRYSNWLLTIAAINEFIWSSSLHYYKFPLWYRKSLTSDIIEMSIDTLILRQKCLEEASTTIEAMEVLLNNKRPINI